MTQVRQFLIRNNRKRRNRDADEFCLRAADSKIGARAAALRFSAHGGTSAKSRSGFFVCVSKNADTATRKSLSLRPFVPDL
jgi:hypothetical protein